MRRIFTLCFLIPNLFLSVVFQVESYSLLAQDFELYPKLQSFITPSPQAAALTKYGDYPVNYNTGLVDMRIPLYNVKSGSLSLPIDISFHASGRMADESNGILGMRWVLNAGGVITRTVKGYPDEWDYLTPYTVNQNQIPDYDQLRSSCTVDFVAWENANPNYNRMDSELDIFRYVLPSGKSGQFVLKNENGIKKAVQIPYETLKIELARDNTYYGYYGAINIIDVDGTIYNYGNGFVQSQYTEFNTGLIDEGIPGSPPTGWYLKDMVSADKKDTIQFDYENINTTKYNEVDGVIARDRPRDYSSYDFFDPHDTFGPYFFYDLDYSRMENTYGSITLMMVPVLKSIKFKEGELYFGYKPAGQNVNKNFETTYLEYIKLSGAVNRKFKFNQQLDPSENFIRYLNNLEILSVSDNLEKVEEKYSFNYYKPSESYASIGSSKSKDWWGYHRYDINTTNSLLPYQSVDFITYANGFYAPVYINIGSTEIRNPHLESMKLGMLKSIIYPTGGETEFEYENNYYKEISNPLMIKEGPGLRIKKVTNKPIVGAEMIKTYKYGENEDEKGYINPALKPGQHTIQESSMMTYWDYLAYGMSGMVQNEQTGLRIRTYSSDPLIAADDFGGNIVRYDEVTEYSGDNETNVFGQEYNQGINGKTVYKYAEKLFDTKQFEITDGGYSINYPKVFADPYRLWQGGKIISKTVYKKEDGVFIPSYEENYNYTEGIFDEVWDMPVYRHVSFSLNKMNYQGMSETQFQYNKEKDYHNTTCSVYGYGFRKYVSGSEKIASKTIKYFDGAGISTISEYFYDPLYDQLRKEETTKSDGKKVGIQYEYPFDKTTLPLDDMTNVYNKMVKMNMISNPLSKSQYDINGINSVFLQSKRTDYSEPHPNVIRPEKEYFKKNSNTEEPLIIYNHYDDKGNPTELQMINGTTVAYIWGYNQTQPVAKIENATQAQIALLSLNMTLINDSATIDSDMQTELQKLRTGLPNAMVTTYTYKPLIGISSIIDPKGYITYYNYDAFGRLQNVKDMDGNILSENEYHYKN